MKLIEAINRVDSLIPNTYSVGEKVAWLSNLDADIKTQIIDNYEGTDNGAEITKYIQAHKKAYEESVTEYMKVHEVSREEAESNIAYKEITYKEAKEHIEATRNDIFFTGYDSLTDLQTELLVGSPHDIMYLRWLEAMIHYHNEEYDKYNNAMSVYNTAFSNYSRYYIRTHKPLGPSGFKL